jgi:hypothetical protein
MTEVLILREVGHRRTSVLELDVVEHTPEEVGEVAI